MNPLWPSGRMLTLLMCGRERTTICAYVPRFTSGIAPGSGTRGNRGWRKVTLGGPGCVAHTDGSGRVYPNFPDLALDDWAAAYHAGNYDRLVMVKKAYDPGNLFRLNANIKPRA